MTEKSRLKTSLNPIQARLFYHLKVQGRPFMTSRTIKANPTKLCTVLLKADQNTERNFQKYDYDVTMTSLLRTMENSDLPETRQIIYHLKGNDESFPKM